MCTGAHHEGNDHHRNRERECPADDEERPPVATHQAPEHDRGEVGKRRLLDQEATREQHADPHERDRARRSRSTTGAGAEEPHHREGHRTDQEALGEREVTVQHRRADDHRDRQAAPQRRASRQETCHAPHGGADRGQTAQQRQRMEARLAGAEQRLAEPIDPEQQRRFVVPGVDVEAVSDMREPGGRGVAGFVRIPLWFDERWDAQHQVQRNRQDDVQVALQACAGYLTSSFRPVRRRVRAQYAPRPRILKKVWCHAPIAPSAIPRPCRGHMPRRSDIP